MKIIVLGPAHPYRGGIAMFSERLARQFQEEGNEVEIWTFTLQYPGFLFPGKTQYSEEPAPSDLSISRKIDSINPFNWIKVGRQLRRSGADLAVVAFWLPYMAPCLGTVSRIAGRGGHTRVVALLHNLIPHEHRPGDRMFVKYFVRSVGCFVAMSESVLSDLNLFDNEKPRGFCPHPLYDNFGERLHREDALKALGLNPEFRYMLFFGLIRDYKGLDLLLRAYADSRFRKMNVRLLVAGEFYGDPEKYFLLEEELGLKGLVIWNSKFIPDSRVKCFFGAADIIVQPYKNATQSGVTQIAYHFEKPMLVTDVGGLAETVPDGKAGYVVAPDPSAIADRLVDFFGAGRQNEFTTGIKEEKRKYAWSNMTAAVLEAAALDK